MIFYMVIKMKRIYYLAFVFLLFTYSNSFQVNDKNLLKTYEKKPEFVKWYTFRNKTFSNVELKNVKFDSSNIVTIISHKLESKRLSAILKRDFLLDYSNDSIYAIDVHADAVFEQNNSATLFKGGGC
jgi:hypothetical protein